MGFSYQRKRRREDQGVDDWLMTYADMITLLLCFFAVFLAVSTPKADAVKKAKSKFMEQFASARPQQTPEARAPDFPFSAAVMEYQGPQGIEAVEQGERITVIEMNSAAVFRTGSAELNARGATILNALLPSLQDKRYADYRITIEGHTDDAPIATPQFPSNWELSTARAAAVVRYFIGRGIPATKLSAAGYADTLPKVPNRGFSGEPVPENQAQNRRVVIKLEKIGD